MAIERSLASLGAPIRDLDQAWEDRLLDLQTLRATGRLPSAVAIATYSLEIRLKVRICEHLDVLSLPKDFEIHDLKGLLVLAGLSHRLDTKKLDASQGIGLYESISLTLRPVEGYGFLGARRWDEGTIELDNSVVNPCVEDLRSLFKPRAVQR